MTWGGGGGLTLFVPGLGSRSQKFRGFALAVLTISSLFSSHGQWLLNLLASVCVPSARPNPPFSGKVIPTHPGLPGDSIYLGPHGTLCPFCHLHGLHPGLSPQHCLLLAWLLPLPQCVAERTLCGKPASIPFPVPSLCSCHHSAQGLCTVCSSIWNVLPQDGWLL